MPARTQALRMSPAEWFASLPVTPGRTVAFAPVLLAAALALAQQVGVSCVVACLMFCL
jgi:hypothetical protein